jgi:hypothetical protein
MQDRKKNNNVMKEIILVKKKVFFYNLVTALFLFTLISQPVIAAETNKRVRPDLVPIYTESTQVLNIAKLGVASGDSGYAYQVDMKLFSTDPIGFVVSNLSLVGIIAADEEISALYDVSSHSIILPQVTLSLADGSQTELRDIKLSLGGDPFVWFYVPATTE